MGFPLPAQEQGNALEGLVRQRAGRSPLPGQRGARQWFKAQLADEAEQLTGLPLQWPDSRLWR
jgi:nitrogen-specific signal transduction histidine kinase